MFGQSDTNQDQNQSFNPQPAGAPEPAADSDLGDDLPVSTPPVTPSTFNPSEFVAQNPAPAPAPSEDTSVPVTTASSNGDDLVGIKQSALQQLTPLVGHLEQTPEEKFRTTMMMIQASDDQSLIKAAYDSAQAITDEKARAQALLDVVNEINYFTQHNSQS